MEILNGVFHGMLPIWVCLIVFSYIRIFKNCMVNTKKMFQYLLIYIGSCQLLIQCTYEPYEYPKIYNYVFFISLVIQWGYMFRLGKKLANYEQSKS